MLSEDSIASMFVYVLGNLSMVVAIHGEVLRVRNLSRHSSLIRSISYSLLLNGEANGHLLLTL